MVYVRPKLLLWRTTYHIKECENGTHSFNECVPTLTQLQYQAYLPLPLNSHACIHPWPWLIVMSLWILECSVPGKYKSTEDTSTNHPVLQRDLSGCYRRRWNRQGQDTAHPSKTQTGMRWVCRSCPWLYGWRRSVAYLCFFSKAIKRFELYY